MAVCKSCGAQVDPPALYCTNCGRETISNGLNEAAKTPSPNPLTDSGRYAGFWRRFLAFVLDELVVGFPYFVVSIFAFRVFSGPKPEHPQPFDSLIFLITGSVFLLATLGHWLYFALMECSSRQATLGKMILNLRVTDMNGNRISFARASGRYFGKFISGMTILIGYIIAGFTEKKQALHDFIAATLVVRTD